VTEIVLYERDQGFVLEKLREGEFDYIETGSEVFETEFFRFIGSQRILAKLAETYPTPRVKEEVPVWLALASNISMRLHGVACFNQFTYVVRCGGMLSAFGPELGRKAHAPESGDLRLQCQGFNEKNIYPRSSPCHPDFLRKFGKDTDAARLQHWYNTQVARLWKKRRDYDKEGLFVGDASYLFVPDNPRYEGSVRMLFDEHNKPADPKKVTARDVHAGCYQWRRCYKLVSLLHTDREGKFFSMVAFRVVPGNAHELPVFYELLEEFVSAVGARVIKLMILDRGFLDGARISYFHQQHGIDFLIPVRRNMDVYGDAMSLIDAVEFVPSERPPRTPVDPKVTPPPKRIRQREKKRRETRERTLRKSPTPPEKTVWKEEVGSLEGFQSWESCTVPLRAVYSRRTYAEGHQEHWILLDTRPKTEARTSRDDYALRVQIEERYRQLKCFSDLTGFTSRAFSLVVNQVLFVLLSYSLVQLYLRRQERKAAQLNRRTPPTIRKELLPAASWVIVYCEGRFAFFDRLEYSYILLTLGEEARRKAAERIRRLRRDLAEFPKPRSP
jgi:hypothetical protein